MSRPRQAKWRMAEERREQAAALESALGCSPLIARLLVNRSIETPEQAAAFLHPSFEQLSDPFLLPDAEAAAERLKQALHKHEKIFIHGDYDGDGVTSAALWTRLLKALKADVDVHVPHRHRDGYDMKTPFVEQARREGVKLIVTTDCGIRRAEEVEEARKAGIDVIITDHHEPDAANLPRAVAVVNPHHPNSRYPFKELAGVGVAFRMGEALVRHLGHSVDSYRRAYVDLAAIGTITDIMPITGENRVFVKHGLERLSETKKPGLRALLALAGLRGKALKASNIGFQIGPRLNAIGRVDDARIALDLLLTGDENEGETLAARIEEANGERQREQMRIFGEAVEQIGQRDFGDAACLVLWSSTWHGGVIGIVANKIVDRYHRPAILISVNEEDGSARGSARSIRPFPMLEAITECRHLLGDFGGHSHAAGFSIAPENVAAFADAMNRIASERLTEEDFRPTWEVDAEVDPAEVGFPLLRELTLFEPWGRGNEEPILVSRGLRVERLLRMGKENQHLKLWVRTPGMNATEAVYWNKGDLAEHLHPGDAIDLCYKPQSNDFNGRITFQFNVLDLRPADMEC